MNRLRLISAVIILVLSISLLVWGFWPAQRERRIQSIPPAEMQLPTPASFQFPPPYFV